MPESHAARGTRRGRRLLNDLGAELRAARVAAGLTLAGVGASAGVSAGELSRIERGLAPWLDIVTAARVCAVVGLDLSVAPTRAETPFGTA
jgi:transcriptional regulator with XRE-family HTH domain